MKDFPIKDLGDMTTSRADINTGTSGSMREIDWGTEDVYWREQYASRPYAKADRGYDYYRPAYEYGVRSASRHRGGQWNDVESELERGWTETRGEAKSTWQEIKDAVRDAWDRATGSHHDREPRTP